MKQMILIFYEQIIRLREEMLLFLNSEPLQIHVYILMWGPVISYSCHFFDHGFIFISCIFHLSHIDGDYMMDSIIITTFNNHL